MLAAAGIAILLRFAGPACAIAPRKVWLGVPGAAVAGAAVLVLAQPAFAGSHTVLFGHYLGDLGRALDKLPSTPAIVFGIAEAAFAPRRFGALFLLLALLACTPRHRAAGGAEGGVPRALVAFTVLLLLTVLAAFYLSPETDVEHHLRSSAPRLRLQLAGVGWLCAGAALAPRLGSLSRPRWLAGPPARAQ
jgi:hypothetical protein